MANARNNKKTGNATIRNQKQNQRKKALRNVIKISKTINKLKNEKIKKKLLSKAKKATEKRLEKIRSLGLKTDSILRQIIEDVITDVYELPFNESGKAGERIAFKLLHHIAEFDNTEIHNREIRNDRRQELRNNLRN